MRNECWLTQRDGVEGQSTRRRWFRRALSLIWISKTKATIWRVIDLGDPAQVGAHAVDHFEKSAGFRQRSSPSDDDAVGIWFTHRRFTGTTGITRPVTASVPQPPNRVDVSTIRQHPLRDFIKCLPY